MSELLNIGVLQAPAAENYLKHADRRVMIGFRYALELLGLPVPEYALRRPRHPSPASAVMAAFRADNPNHRPLTLAPRRPNASPETVANARAQSAFGRNL